MTNHPRALVAWSSGKDSAWALHALRQAGEVEVAGLLTTFNEAFDRVAMHAVRRELVEAQARAAGLPLIEVPLPWPCSNAAYEEAMGRALAEARAQLKITHVAFGDLFLEDVRQYRESRMQGTGLTPLFPLWGRSTRTLADEMVHAGLKARITCVDPNKLSPSYAGRLFDGNLVEDLPDEVDPCGERGEFHTFACAGPMFAYPIPVSLGEVVARDGFIFADLLPGTTVPD
ncbi:MAG: ATP-binding protein [Candidatus Methylomirabilota bacterium]|nr:MAG: ATP-binding protein [candidate division NC10 bacterium]